MNLLLIVPLFLVVAGLYLAPTIIAFKRGVSFAMVILIADVCFAWLVWPWFILLALAFWPVPERSSHV